jgi:hypothetical protein
LETGGLRAQPKVYAVKVYAVYGEMRNA